MEQEPRIRSDSLLKVLLGVLIGMFLSGALVAGWLFKSGFISVIHQASSGLDSDSKS